MLYGTFVYNNNSIKRNSTTYDKRTNVGDIVKCETEYLGVLTGRIIKQSFNLNGGIIIKETEMK
jgi:hypothetical protein